jgi:hypothetical protein
LARSERGTLVSNRLEGR